jgi:predicted transcriptional regulator
MLFGRGGGGVRDHGSLRRGAGELESAILEILRASGAPLTAGEVRRLLAAAQQAELSYSTVVTIVSRLHAKGLLSRERAGRGFAYRPVDEASLAARQMSHALDSGTDRGAVLTRFVSDLSGRDARLLRQLLAGAPEPPAGEAGRAGEQG